MAFTLTHWGWDQLSDILKHWGRDKIVDILAHWGWDKMANILQTIFSNAFSWMKSFEFFNKMSLKYVPEGVIDNKSVLVQVLVWHLTSNKPSPGPMLTKMFDALYSMTRPQRIKKNPISVRSGQPVCKLISGQWKCMSRLVWNFYQLSHVTQGCWQKMHLIIPIRVPWSSNLESGSKHWRQSAFYDEK